jgi:uncharacterized membrane protein
VVVAIAVALVGLMCLMSAWGWRHIPPDQAVAIHWGLNRRPDGFASRSVALVLLPALAIAVAAALLLLMAALPGRSGPAAVATFRVALIAALAILCVAHGIVIGVAARHSNG